jgi:hypothetical protein
LILNDTMEITKNNVLRIDSKEQCILSDTEKVFCINAHVDNFLKGVNESIILDGKRFDYGNGIFETNGVKYNRENIEKIIKPSLKGELT